MPYPDTAEGFMIHDQKKWGDFSKQEFKLKPFEDHDIDVAVECCGVCGSDVHTINGMFVMFFFNMKTSGTQRSRQ